MSNPPFKLDFSEWRDQVETLPEASERFFAGVPKVPAKSKDKMAIYELFVQHIIYSLKPDGKAAVVLPTGFITAQSGIDKTIRQHLVDNQMLAGVVSMPSNIFATTGTNVSILFIDKKNKGDVVLIDASKTSEPRSRRARTKRPCSLQKKSRRSSRPLSRRKLSRRTFQSLISYEDIKEKNLLAQRRPIL